MSDPSPAGRPLAKRLAKIKPSATLKIAAEAGRLKAQGVDIVSLAAGEPDFDTPAHIQEAAIAAMRAGKTRYTPTAGIPELRAAVAAKLKAENDLVYDPAQVIVGAGAKNILYTAAQVLFDPGDEVVICAPFWVSYPDQVFLNDARPVIIRTREKDDFKVHPDVLAKTVGSKTKALILNTPGNPTGAAYDREDLEAIARIALERDLWIISDEIYERIVFDGFRHVSIAALSPEVAARTIVVNGFSKTYAMTGWRLGYAAGPSEVVQAMNIVQSQNVSNAPSIAQWGGVAALTGDQACVNEMVAAFQERKDYVVGRLNAMEGVWCFEPKGSFYVFPRIAHYFGMQAGDREIQNSLDMAGYLLDSARVSVVPGGAFGGDEYVRISFATGMDQLTEGLDRMERALAALTPGPHYAAKQEHLEQKRF
jgi:aspartate aminotransferase